MQKISDSQTLFPLVRKSNGEWTKKIKKKADIFADLLSNVFSPPDPFPPITNLKLKIFLMYYAKYPGS